MRIVFPFIAHLYQVPHALPIAAELAARNPSFEITLATVSDAQERVVREILASYLPNAPLRIHRLAIHPFDRWRGATGEAHWKQLTLLHNRAFFAGFDAVVTPEQTTLFLRRLGLPSTRLIWTRHGAGDRESGFSSRVRGFDFVLMSGAKIEQRLLDKGLIRPGAYATGIYPKFDWLRARACETTRPLFDNDRPTVLYNPHFRQNLSSWPRVGRQVLETLANSSRYNLVFAPHIRLFGRRMPTRLTWLEDLARRDNVHIDLGSDCSLDATYTMGANLYLGDVSSQAAEFVSRPRPCLFLNPRRVDWKKDCAYRSWTLGPVIESVDGLEDRIAEAIAGHGDYRARQQAYIAETFGVPTNVSSAITGADAIATWLRTSATRPEPLDLPGHVTAPGR